MSNGNHVSKKYKIINYSDDKQNEEWKEILIEYKLTLFVNNVRYVNLICTRKNLHELVIGNLYAEGIINRIEDIERIDIREEQGKVFVELKIKDVFKDVIEGTEGVRTVTTACGKQHSISYYVLNESSLTVLKDCFLVHDSEIMAFMNEFQQGSDIYKLTRGIHSCGLYHRAGIIYLMEDIGRHNAVDKVLGYALNNHIDLSQTILITSGRVPSDMITKVIKAQIPIVVARSVPTDIAIEMADKFNVTLVGFARSTRINVYTNHFRIIHSR